MNAPDYTERLSHRARVERQGRALRHRALLDALADHMAALPRPTTTADLAEQWHTAGLTPHLQLTGHAVTDGNRIRHLLTRLEAEGRVRRVGRAATGRRGRPAVLWAAVSAKAAA